MWIALLTGTTAGTGMGYVLQRGGLCFHAMFDGALAGRGRLVRYVQLAVGGFLLGGGGWIAGGCNLAHGLSGAAQLSVSSWVVGAALVAGVGVSHAARRAVTEGSLSRASRRGALQPAGS